MYPKTCPGGYLMPLMVGKFSKLLGFRATVKVTSAASRLVLIDDSDLATSDKFGRVLPPTHAGGTRLCDIKGIGNDDANLELIFPEPVQTRYGISAVDTENLVAGSISVYVQ